MFKLFNFNEARACIELRFLKVASADAHLWPFFFAKYGLASNSY